ncbi:MAG: serine hydrolase domain-containing protein [Chitinophagales bacterium]|nr:serine hydrolase domain-containing protein [Chitinophagales bacterium]
MKFGLRPIFPIIALVFVSLSCGKGVVQTAQPISNAEQGSNAALILRDYEKIGLAEVLLDKLDGLPLDVELPSLVYNHRLSRIDSLIDSSFKYNGFNGAVLVAEKGQILVNKAVGFANFSTGELLQSNSIFELASVSKQFTAMSIMLLKQQGKLSFDDDMLTYLPELPYQGITIRHLLNHTSGLPNYMWLVDNRWKESYAPYNEDVIALMAKYKPQVYFKPGAKFTYSNTGYMLLAAIVERVSGEEFIDFVDHHIFQPLGMTNSYVYSAAKECNYKECLNGYRMSKRGLYQVPIDDLDGSVGDKGVHSTVEDLFKWDQALYTDRLVRKDILEEAFTKGKTNLGKDVDYGFGFRIAERNGRKVIYHNGLWHGFRTAIIRDVERQVTIIVLNHTNSYGKHAVVYGIERILNENDPTYITLPEGDITDHTTVGEE